MFKSLKSIALQMVLIAGVVAPLVLVSPAEAQLINPDGGISGNLDSGATATDPEGGDNPEERVEGIITTTINVFSLVVGVISVIMIIIGGLKYITSGGDSGNVTGAKNTILYAIIGLVVVALAQVIVRFVLTTATDL